MPANLTQQYLKAEQEYRRAATPDEELHCLQAMLRELPKHKGTDKLQAELKQKISRTKKEAEAGRQGKGRKGHGVRIPRQGAGTVAVLGGPNAGKSQLVRTLTNATPEVAEYPFTTHQPLPAMMPFEAIQFQLVDMPPITRDTYDGWMTNLIRNGDLLVLMVDLASDDLLDGLEEALEVIKEAGIVMAGEKIPKEYENSVFCKKTLLLANKIGEANAPQNFKILKEFYGDRFPIMGISILRDRNVDQFKRRIFELLEIIRVYTKTPGKEVDYSDPIILPFDSTVEDAALSIHKDFAHKLQYAKLWGEGKFDGQRVTNSFRLTDGDVIEFHI